MADAVSSNYRLVTRREAEPILGYAPGSLKAVMQQQPGRWPEPVACRLRDRALQWRLNSLESTREPRNSGRDRRPNGSDPDGLVTCLSCGRRFRSLGPHLARIHQVTAAEYRAEHHLRATTALMADSVRDALSTARVEAMADDPELIERMRASALPADELARRSTDGRASTNDLPAVRAARRASALQAQPAAVRARRAALEAVARAAGFGSMLAAIKATRGLSSRAAAERIGVGATTVKRWRRMGDAFEGLADSEPDEPI